jgi:DNA-binding protein H-NS
MARTLAQIETQIAKLQQRADAIKAKEMVGVIERIRDAVGHYGLTPEHIFGVQAAKAPPPRKAKASVEQVAVKKTAATQSAVKGKRVAIKYRDDKGNAWSGRGSQPRWLRTAVENGMSREDFSVKA